MKLLKTKTSMSFYNDCWFKYRVHIYVLEWDGNSNKHYRLF